ncbi:hypothetical protein CEXT_466351 [Caerostris extrusa]|uniref:Uncharacterized protein n=1 Tax=Caerostris extrusa TaxID=172846 RepID=A0AAV4U8B2_CAEEX|nr:hypothetical protein CEXT_466351 [Caerostris extrusa]
MEQQFRLIRFRIASPVPKDEQSSSPPAFQPRGQKQCLVMDLRESVRLQKDSKDMGSGVEVRRFFCLESLAFVYWGTISANLLHSGKTE